MARRSRKSAAEARAERVSWFMLVLVFILLSFDDAGTIPGIAVAFYVGVVAGISALYQWRRGWRVSPIVWIIIGVLILFGVYYYAVTTYLPTSPIAILAFFDPILIALIATVVIILFGTVTNEG